MLYLVFEINGGNKKGAVTIIGAFTNKDQAVILASKSESYMLIEVKPNQTYDYLPLVEYNFNF